MKMSATIMYSQSFEHLISLLEWKSEGAADFFHQGNSWIKMFVESSVNWSGVLYQMNGRSGVVKEKRPQSVQVFILTIEERMTREQSFDNVIQLFGRKTPLLSQDAFGDTFFFQFRCDEQGFYLKTVDSSFREVSPRAECYHGAIRTVLRHLEQGASIDDFDSINWFGKTGRMYVKDSPEMVYSLQDCQNLVDEGGRKLQFSEETGKIMLALSEQKKVFHSQFQLLYKGGKHTDFQIVTEYLVLHENKLIRIPPIGRFAEQFKSIETGVLRHELELYLSLVLSHVDNVKIDLEGYRFVRGDVCTTKPALIIEQIDEENNLHVRMTQVIPNKEIDLLERYEISRVVSIKEQTGCIEVSDVVLTDSSKQLSTIWDSIKKLSRNLTKTSEGRLSNYYIDENLIVLEENIAVAFIQEILPILLHDFELFGADKLKLYNVKAIRPRLRLNVSFGIDYLKGDASLEFDGESISLIDAMGQFSRQSYVTLKDGTAAIVDKQYMNKLVRLFKKSKNGVTLSFFDLPLVEELIEESAEQTIFKRSREIFRGFTRLNDRKVSVPKLKTTLWGYQKQGLKWLDYLHEQSFGGCLADEMGLGKTVQVIAHLARFYPEEKRPTLIIVPVTILFNWACEIEKFRPELTYYTYHGPARDPGEIENHQVILSTYSTVRNDIKTLMKKDFFYVILDESQQIKNIKSQISKAVLLLPNDHRLAMSGTPLENNLSELYSLFRFLNPAMFGQIQDFNRNYIVPIQKDSDDMVTEELRKKVYPFILRRLKKDVIKDLPDKVESVVYTDMGDDHRLFYEEKRLFYQSLITTKVNREGLNQSKFDILQALLELRQIAAIPEIKSDDRIVSKKREMVLHKVREVLANNHKILIFTNFLYAVELIKSDLEDEGIQPLVITGKTKEKDRAAFVERFQTDDQCPVFILTLKTGGLGLNLTAAEYIFLYDPWWNVAAEAQAIDRSHRIGQYKTVFSYRLICKGTIEERILELQERKKELFNSLITSDGLSIKSLTEDDINYIFT